MKVKFLLLLGALIVFSFSLSFGFGITIDQIDGLYGTSTDSIQTDVPVVFHLRLTNDSSFIVAGITNGFNIYSPDGATWGGTVGDTVYQGWGNFFNLQKAIGYFGVDGVGADTLGFGGAAFGIGIPSGFDTIAFTITIGPIDTTNHGKTICIDSSWYPPIGEWLWSAVSADTYVPNWYSSPQCFTIINPNAPTTQGNIILSIDSLEFTGVENGANPSSQTLNISSDRDPFNFSLSKNAGWLTITPAQGTTPQNITVSVNTAGLTAGDYIDSIMVSSSDADNSPQYAYVHLKITPAPKYLVISPSAFNVTAVVDGANPTSRTFKVTETSGFAIPFSATENISWLSLSNATGTTPGDVTININITGLAVGTYIDTIVVTSSDPDVQNSPQIVVVNLQVSPSPEFVINPDTLLYTTVAGDTSTMEQSFHLSTSDSTPISYGVHETSPWIAIPSNIGVTPNDIVVVVNPQGLPEGVYFDSLIISEELPKKAAAPTIAPAYAYVKLTVTKAPKMLALTPDSLVFTTVEGGTEPDTLGFTVTEQGGASIPFTATESILWLDLSGFTSGTTPHLIKVAVHEDTLPAGVYLDSIQISSSEADNSPVYLPVYFYVSEKPNNPPVITAINDTTITECDSLIETFSATDADNDSLDMWVSPLVDNMTFTDNHNGTGLFAFHPNFSQAGVYPTKLYVTDGRDTVSAAFTITVEECQPGTEGDTVSVSTVPAVPGAQVMVQVDFANLCDLKELDAHLMWSSSYLNLDSATFADSRLAAIANKNITIDNANNILGISSTIADTESIVPGYGNLVNLYFSLAVETPAGFYPIDLDTRPASPTPNPMYIRDCGEGSEMSTPFFIPGGIVVDTSANYVCGYVVDTAGNPVPGATVELWDDFPGGSIVKSMSASGNGVFSFSDFNTIPFDLWAYKDGYYPAKVENINFAQSGIMLVLTPYEPVVKTNTNVRYYCDYNTYLDAPLPVGSVIDAYDPDGVRCGTFTVTEAGKYGFLYVYGDDIYEEGDQGAVSGDVIRFFVNGVEATPSVTPIWTEDRDKQEVCLDVPNVTVRVCHLRKGWNLISWNVDTPTDDILDVFSSISDCLEVVMGFEQGALTYDAELPLFSDLWQVDHLSGYWVKVSCDADLDVTGMPVPTSTPIPVTAGWNLVSYLPDTPLPTQVALSSIYDNLIVALGYDSVGMTYVPGDDLHNDLIGLKPCHGYWVKVTQNGTLSYPSQGPTVASQSGKNILANLSSNQNVIPTTSWINLYSPDLTLNGATVQTGSEIDAYTLNDVKVGSYTMKKDGLFGFMPIYGDDKSTEQVDGVKSGQSFYLTVNGIRTEQTFTWNQTGDKIKVTNLTAKSTSNETLPVTYSLNQNYPNPFNPTTTISFNLPQEEHAKIEIFNLLGKLVAVPYNDIAKAGLNQIEWNGKSDNGNHVASGIYFYRLTTDNYMETKKMTLLK
ncbi:MAG: T9SS type A sorting domain-containing protein [FCB group bacterium]|nr:T9SS type A sorting domain-containing protein [FCB group bacterium]